uniref:Zinc finger protein with KRAB and SCAN domains 8 n=1 Tax=Cacopsylla melanoneura TaxID=428564 RepID=A0A8D8PYL6_9HEMI
MDTLVAVAEGLMDTQDQNVLPQSTMSQNDMENKMDLIMTNTSLVPQSQSLVPQSQPIKEQHIPMDSIKCLVCDFNVTSSARYDVLYTLLPKSGNLLCDVMNKVLRTNFVDTDTMRSSVLCEVCLNLFNDLEFAEIRCRKLRTTLIEDYRKTCELYGEFLDDASYGVACQTDLLACDILLNVKEEIIPATRSKSKRPKRTRSKAKTKKKYETSDEESVDYDRDLSEPAVIDQEDSDVREDDVRDTIDYSNTIVKPDPDGESDSATLPVRPVKDKRKKRNRRTHPCEHCSRKFRSQAEVKNHILVKHLDQNPNECVFCQKKLNSRSGLFSHLKNVHNIGYSDRKELISNLDEDSSQSEVSKDLLIRQQKILESTIVQSDTEYEPGDGSQSEAQGYESGEPSSGTKRARRSSSRTRSRSRTKDQKENLGSRSNQGGVKGAKVVTVKYLSEEGIGEEAYVVKEEGNDNILEGELIEKNENEEEEEEEKPRPKKAPRKRNRAPRIGERACMPLIHECPTCGKKWRTVSELNAHKQTHSDLRPFVCEICGQGYKMRKALLVHVGMHNGIHPFTCSYCNKSFTQKVGLEKHMYIHTQTRRFQCDLCGKGFIHLKSYQIHKMIHSGERHIKCQVCGLALLSKSHLKQHLRVHTGERPHECDACGKRFAKKSNLNAHKKKVHHIVLTPPVIAPVVMPATEAVGVPVLPLPELLPALNGLPAQNPDHTGIVVVKEDQDPLAASPHKCQMCPFTSNRKQSLQEHWERDHNRYLNTYTGENEQFTM